MAYAGTTSTSPNPPRLMSQAMGSTSGRIWVYNSTFISSDIEATGFLTDGKALGMKGGDILMHFTSTGGIVTTHTVLTVTSTAAELSVGSTIGLAA